MFPVAIRGYYDTHRSLHELNVFALSGCGGGSLNLVLWKHLFVNFTLMLGPEQQWRNYNYPDVTTKTTSYMSITGDFRASVGLNYKHFFVLLNSTSDFSWYNASQINYLSTYRAVNFLIGARIHTKPSKIHQKF